MSGDLEGVQDSHKMDSVWLLNLYHAKLYSLAQYKSILTKISQEYPQLLNYSSSNTMFLFGDHPTFMSARKLLAQNNIPLPAISRLGTFHIWLNLVEHAGKVFWHIFNSIHHSLFGSHLAAKPKFHHLVYLSTLVLLSWIPIRDRILQKFKLSKDPSYQSILFFLDEVVPLLVLIYSVIFRANALQEWEEALGRITFLFITWHRIRYVSLLQYIT